MEKKKKKTPRPLHPGSIYSFLFLVSSPFMDVNIGLPSKVQSNTLKVCMGYNEWAPLQQIVT